MAPPRQRGPGLDDSRSEASSTRGNSTKGRRANTTAASNLSTSIAQTSVGKDGKQAGNTTAVDENQNAMHNLLWADMPLPVLHTYRYAYYLPCPSAYSTEINRILLSQGIGLKSPTAIAMRRAQSETSSPPTKKRKRSGDATKREKEDGKGKEVTEEKTREASRKEAESGVALAQSRVSKTQLANAARKHFNNVPVSEQEAIARFLYKVCEERKGRELRLRFQP